MLSRQQAEDLVQGILEEVARDVPGGVALMNEHTIERPYGWVFFYNSRRFLETGDRLESLCGNSPILIESATGRVTELGTATPVGESLHRFEIENGLSGESNSERPKPPAPDEGG